MTDREAMQQALEALEQYTDVVASGNEPDTWITVVDAGKPARDAITALRERLAREEPVDSDEKAGAYMDAKLWEFIDMAAAFPTAQPDPRTWGHVMVYAPKPARQEQEPVAWEDVLGAIARGWTHEDNKHKPMDVPLAVAIAKEVQDMIAAPQRREWVGLTDEEIKEIIGPWGDTPIKGYTRKLFDQIEAKLKENNA